LAEYFDRGQVLIGGAPIASLENGSIELANGKQDVVAIAGWLGVTKGPLVATITAKRAVPRAGIPKGQDLHDAVVKQRFVSAMAICGGKKYVVTGVPAGLRRDFGATATAMEDFSIHGAVEITDV
jgi:hypothetical protein